ncbi:MAG: DegT/DnrJ/EryC1/StrS family aminotransferase [Deltaproteobacteria bacterium]|nr:DegT/DnrJ/EryC1/StrS family aminotransferase [Deltaproteobacteria bacterium]
MKIPLVDLKAQYAAIAQEIDQALAEVIDETAFISGTFARRFEAEFSAYVGAKFCLGVGNGTDALAVAMKGLGLKPGQEVIVPALTFIATSEAVTLAGGQVVFADVDPETRCLDPQAAEAAVSPRTKGLIAVHLYGHPAQMTRLKEIADRHGLWLIEDAAQAHGAVCGDKKVGGQASAGCFSFYPGKNLGAYGDAGAVVCDDEALDETMRMLANHGRKDKYGHLFEGFNSRLDGLQAAVLSVKLRHLDDWNQARRRAAAGYRQRLGDLPLVLPQDHPGHVYYVFVVQTPRRDELAAHLKAQGIGASIHFPDALPRLPAYDRLGHGPGSFPVAEGLASEVLSLPLFPEISEGQLDYVADQIRTFFERT